MPTFIKDIDATVEAIRAEMSQHKEDDNPYVVLQSRAAPVMAEIVRFVLEQHNKGEDFDDVVSALICVVGTSLFNVIKNSQMGGEELHDAIHHILKLLSGVMHDAYNVNNGEDVDGIEYSSSVKIETEEGGRA